MATRWRPDTCRCVLIVNDWDTDDAVTEQTCPHHEGLSGRAHMAVVYRGENQVKNFALGEIDALEPGASDGAVVRFLGSPQSPIRHCEITLPDHAKHHRNAAAGRINAWLGNGKVTVR